MKDSQLSLRSGLVCRKYIKESNERFSTFAATMSSRV